MMMLTSLNSYTKNMKLQMQWDLKQKNGDYSSHKSLQEWLGESQQEEEGKGSDEQLKSIHQKLFAGGKLTSEERRYLQAKDPEAYAKLEASERDQKAFEQRLKQCKTKEEAQRLKMTYLGSSLITVRAVENNPNISVEKKLEIMMQEKQRCDRIEESAREFVRRGEYDKLPSQAEEAKAQKDEAKAREEKAEAKEPEKTGARQEAKEKPKEIVLEEAKKPAIETETPEQRKVRRAKARAAYRRAAEPVPVKQPSSTVDVKA